MQTSLMHYQIAHRHDVKPRLVGGIAKSIANGGSLLQGVKQREAIIREKR